MDLDELLATSAPSVTERSPELQRGLDLLVAATEPSQRQRRRLIRGAVVGASLAGVFGIGAAASAVGILPGWPSFSTSSGQSCGITMSASALQPGEGEPISASFSPSERAATLDEAKRFLADFDYEAVDRQTAVAWYRAEEAKIRASQPDPKERQPRLVGDDLEVTAVSRYVVDQLSTHLSSEGLDVRAIMVSVGTGCVL